MTQTSSTPHGDQDFRLIAARRVVWDENAWQAPAHIWLVIRSLRELMGEEDRSKETLAEAAMLMKKLAASHNGHA